MVVVKRVNVSVKDRIVVVRYGQIFRGTKVLLAQQRGAVGVLIYSDPADDGYVCLFCKNNGIDAE